MSFDNSFESSSKRIIKIGIPFLLQYRTKIAKRRVVIPRCLSCRYVFLGELTQKLAYFVLAQLPIDFYFLGYRVLLSNKFKTSFFCQLLFALGWYLFLKITFYCESFKQKQWYYNIVIIITLFLQRIISGVTMNDALGSK